MMRTRAVIVALFLLAISGTVFAQAAQTQGNTSQLRPPKGQRIALVVFEDLQCPDCAHAENTLKDAEKQFNIPLVRHDFPLPQHNWSFEAHVIARWLDTKSPAIGEEFRHWVFVNQPSITKANLRGMAERFADEHNITLPENVDPKGELAAKVKADFAYGQQIGVGHTPTIYIVTDAHRTQPIVEVVDRMQLFSMIDDIKKQLDSEKTASK